MNKKYLTDALDKLPGGFMIYRADGEKAGEILFANKQLISFFDCCDFEEFMEHTDGCFKGMVYYQDINKAESNIWGQIHSGSSAYEHVNYRILTKDGRIKSIENFGRILEDDEEGKLFYVFLIDSEKKYHTYELNKLTGLPGMGRFLSFSERFLAINSLNEHAPQFAFVFFNIRHFKMINVKLGVESGDRFLKRIAQIISERFSEGLVAHLADDHFAVLTDVEDLEKKITEVHELVEAESKYLAIEIKAGIYFVEGECDPVVACDYAKLACDNIRSSVTEYCCIYTPAMSKAYEISQFAAKNLDEAIKNGNILVYYQPVIRTLSGQVCGFEALARWYDNEYGLLPPGLFISALEENRQIYKLDCYMIEQICKKCREIIDNGKTPVPISFNLSRFDFLLCDIFEVIESSVAKYSVPREMIHIEITESMVISDAGRIKKIIGKLHKAGYQIWMDDFGSGYSSLGVLKDYEFDELKIDMAFLTSFNKKSKDIITSIVDMAKKIGIKTLAEGVETAEQYEFLRNIGCEKVQGFYFSKPLPYDQCVQGLNEKNITQETPELKEYFEPVGSLDFLTDMAFALIEKNGDDHKFIFINAAYLKELKTIGLNDPAKSKTAINQDFVTKHAAKAIASRKEESISFYENGSRIRITSKLIAECGDRYILRVFMTNITTNRMSEYHAHMDSRLKAVYHMYAAVYLLKTDDEDLELIHFRDRYPELRSFVGVTFNEARLTFAQKSIDEADRKDFLEFFDTATLSQRISNSKFGFLSRRFETTLDNVKCSFVYSVSVVPGSAGTEFIITLSDN